MVAELVLFLGDAMRLPTKILFSLVGFGFLFLHLYRDVQQACDVDEGDEGLLFFDLGLQGSIYIEGFGGFCFFFFFVKPGKKFGSFFPLHILLL
ncbi:hypothetical protein Dimus_024818 [Dionaea muscipula]